MAIEKINYILTFGPYAHTDKLVLSPPIVCPTCYGFSSSFGSSCVKCNGIGLISDPNKPTKWICPYADKEMIYT